MTLSTRLAMIAGALTAATCTFTACSRPANSSAPKAALPGASWQQPILIDSGQAHRGPWRMNESDFRWVDDPAVAVTRNGDAAVVWVDQARKRVLFQRYGSDGQARLREPVQVSRSPETFSWLPRVVVDADHPERVYTLWQEIVFSGGSHGGEIFFASSADGGASFDQPENLSNTPAGCGKGRLDADTWDNGSLDLALRGRELHAAWTEYEGGLWLRSSSDQGRSFQQALRVAGSPQAPARGPSLALGAGQTVFLAWAVGEDPTADIHVAASKDGGRTFGDAMMVGEADSHADAPRLAIDAGGTVHLVYAESPAGRNGPYHVRYARMRSGAAGFEPPRTLPGSEDRAASAHFPEVRVDAVGRIFVLWKLYPRGSVRSRGLAFTYSADRGDSFGPPSAVPGVSAVEPGVDGSQQGSLTSKLAVGRDGSIAIVNSTFLPGRASHVWLVRGALAR